MRFSNFFKPSAHIEKSQCTISALRERASELIKRGEADNNFSLFESGIKLYKEALINGDPIAFTDYINLLTSYGLKEFTHGLQFPKHAQLTVDYLNISERHFAAKQKEIAESHSDKLMDVLHTRLRP